jgi:uncharacterized protein with HXXEE motif
MTLSQWLWLATAAYGVHVLEEFVLDWRDWARAVVRLPVEWSDFYVVNALVIVLGVVAANLADALPGVALGFTALMLINAVFFHIAPVFATRGRFSPGLITAITLFLPIGIATFWTAHAGGLLSIEALAGAFFIGAMLMAAPIVLLKLKDRPYFRQV